jgi:hypothetical protein
MNRERTTQPSLLDRWREIETPAMWFLLMNALDCALTFIMLRHKRYEEDGTIRQVGVESNEIARFFLDRWGIQGLFGFKLASAVFVCAIAYIIAFKNVDTARRLLALGTLIILAIVVYSAWLAKNYIHG